MNLPFMQATLSAGKTLPTLPDSVATSPATKATERHNLAKCPKRNRGDVKQICSLLVRTYKHDQMPKPYGAHQSQVTFRKCNASKGKELEGNPGWVSHSCCDMSHGPHFTDLLAGASNLPHKHSGIQHAVWCKIECKHFLCLRYSLLQFSLSFSGSPGSNTDHTCQMLHR